MLILSRVCAEFVNRSGETIFSITPQNMYSFLNAPDEIQEDPLFAMMIRDGSLEAVQSVAQRRELEANPSEGIAPDGKRRAFASESPTTVNEPSTDSAPNQATAAPKSGTRSRAKANLSPNPEATAPDAAIPAAEPSGDSVGDIAASGSVPEDAAPGSASGTSSEDAAAPATSGKTTTRKSSK